MSGTKRLYEYAGPREIAEQLANIPPGTPIRRAQDIEAWIGDTGQQADEDDIVIATFVVDESGVLLIADRRSEHVACAAGKPVRSAGEISFALNASGLSVIAVTNQSTGYCPEPESWLAVAKAMHAARIDYSGPDRFEPVFEFRRCPSCGAINVIKEAALECNVCGRALPVTWNVTAI